MLSWHNSVHTHKAGSSHSSVDTHMNGNSSSDMNVNSHHTWIHAAISQINFQLTLEKEESLTNKCHYQFTLDKIKMTLDWKKRGVAFVPLKSGSTISDKFMWQAEIIIAKLSSYNCWT